MTRLRGTLIAAAVPLLLLGACAQQTASGSPASSIASGTGTPESAKAKWPAANDLVLRTESYGGFVAPDMILGRFPQVSVYGDGRVITQGAVPSIYPGPALPNLQVTMITPEFIQSLVQQGLAAGVRNGSDLGQPGVADAPTTRVTVVTAGGKQVVTANALSEAPSNDRRLTTEQRDARAKIAAFVKKLGALANRPGVHSTNYQPTAVVVYASPWTKPATGPVPPAQAWPGPALPGTDIDPATKAGCVAVTGAATPKVLTAAKGANALTPWTTGYNKWRVVFRPLLPDENGCAAVNSTR